MVPLKVASIFLALTLMTIPSQAVMNPHGMDPQDILPYKLGQLLVKTIDGASIEDIGGTASTIDAELIEQYTIVPGLLLYRFNSDEISVDDAIEAFLTDGNVEYAEPDYYYHAAAPNDPRYPELWGLENTGQTGGTVDADINADAMWQIQTGSSSVVLGVIDTGINYNHQDLIPNLWRNPLEIPNNSIDDDGNGYVDDVYGVNAIANNGNPFDDNSHGSHVAGTIGAKGNNSLGVVGVNQIIQIVSCKFLGANGSGGISDAIECMQYFANLKSRANGPVNLIASNNSWGGGGASNAMRDAIAAHQNLGILFVAAAGNATNNNDDRPFYPSGYVLSNLISVAATDHNDRLASFSNYGKRTVHVGAPGNRILSTVLNQDYAVYSGTSMAAPHVTGLIGVIKSNFPNLDYRAIKNLVMASGTPVAALENTTISGRRIRGADANGRGALTCNNQNVRAKIEPATNSVNIPVGGQIALSAVNINCGVPAGNVTLYNNNNVSVVLQDGGTNGDQTAGDGIYSLLWRPQTGGVYQLNYGNGEIVTVTVGTSTPGRTYKAYSNIPYEYETITGTSLNVGDDTVHSVSVPFAIPFNDQPGVQNIYVSSNGAISPTSSTNPGYTNRSLPTATIPTLVAAFWDDLIPTTGDSNVYTETTGSAPNRKFIVEWRNLKHYSATGTGTFQAIFYESSPDIRLNYLDTNFGNTGYNSGSSATVGVQTQTTAATLFSFNTPAVPSQASVLFRLE